MFRTVPLSIIRGSSPYTQQWYMSYMFADCLRAGLQAVSKHVSFQQDGSPTIDSCLKFRACTSRLGAITDLLM